jgi:hypothetical protein
MEVSLLFRTIRENCGEINTQTGLFIEQLKGPGRWLYLDSETLKCDNMKEIFVSFDIENP